MNLSTQLERFSRLAVYATVAFALNGCGVASSTLSPDVPGTLDLSGIWVIDETQSDGSIDRIDSQRQFERDSIDGRASETLGSLYYAEQDFPIVSSTRLEIEQDEHSIGILYGVGKYRDLIWGLQERGEWKLDVGWQGAELLIKSSISHTRGLETYRLSADSMTLSVHIQIRAGGERRVLQRTFLRES